MSLQSIGKLLKNINDTLYKHVNNQWRKEDLTLSQMSLLMDLEQHPQEQVSLKELERVMHVAQSTIVGTVSRLEKKGLLPSCTDAQDKRVKKVMLTQAGHERCQQARVYMSQDENDILIGFSPKEEQELLQYLERIYQNLLKMDK